MGFVRHPQPNPVRYDHPDWYVEIWIGQGDNDVLLGNKLNSNLTTLQQLIRAYHPGPFPLLQDFPKQPGATDDEHYLHYASRWLKTYLPIAIKQ